MHRSRKAESFLAGENVRGSLKGKASRGFGDSRVHDNSRRSLQGVLVTRGARLEVFTFLFFKMRHEFRDRRFLTGNFRVLVRRLHGALNDFVFVQHGEERQVVRDRGAVLVSELTFDLVVLRLLRGEHLLALTFLFTRKDFPLDLFSAFARFLCSLLSIRETVFDGWLAAVLVLRERCAKERVDGQSLLLGEDLDSGERS